MGGHGPFYYPKQTAQAVVRVAYPGHRGHLATLDERKTAEL
jgi:hypothetical protein